jgi:hypothetical protein
MAQPPPAIGAPQLPPHRSPTGSSVEGAEPFPSPAAPVTAASLVQGDPRQGASDADAGGAADAGGRLLESAATQLSPPVDLAAPGGLDALVGAVTMSVRAGVPETVVSLRPGSLGQLRIQLSPGTDGMTIRITADTEAAGSLLRGRVGELRDGLARRGVSIADLHVLPNAPAIEAADGAREAPERRRRPGQPEPPAGFTDQPANRAGVSAFVVQR